MGARVDTVRVVATEEQLNSALVGAAYGIYRGNPRAAAVCAREIAGGRFGSSDRLVDAAIMTTVRRALEHAFQRGWLPEDVHQVATRMAGARHTAYLVDLIADNASRHAPATVHQRWQEQVRELDATVWWPSEQTHLSQWARKHGCDRLDALTVVVQALGLLMSLPTLPQVLPLPGEASGALSERAEPVDEKVLGRVRGLLAKAESTQFAEEAEALSAKAQELMTRHAFDRALLDATAHRQVATARRIWLDNPYAGAKSLLVQAVARANRCRAVYHSRLGFVSVLGDEVDLRIVELLSTSLLVQASKAMLAMGEHSRSRTRSYRQAFLVAYAGRIGERLDEVTEANLNAEAGSGRLLPVLAARGKVVDELFESMFPEATSRSVSVTNTAGWAAGRVAADLATLTSHPSVGHS